MFTTYTLYRKADGSSTVQTFSATQINNGTVTTWLLKMAAQGYQEQVAKRTTVNGPSTGGLR